MGKRICRDCGEAKDLTEFHADKRGPGGRRTQCKVCRSEQMKIWYAANQVRQRDRQRARVAADRDHIRDLDRQRYERHREQRVDLVKAIGHRQRALCAGADGESGITVAELRERDGDRCCYCGRQMTFELLRHGEFDEARATIEHRIPISRGGAHTWVNVALACWSCNRDKRAQTPDEWHQAATA